MNMLLNEDDKDDDVDYHLPFLSWQTLPATPPLKALCLKIKWDNHKMEYDFHNEKNIKMLI